MAILIEKAKINNTEIEVSNIYGRLSYNALPDGSQVSVGIVFYTSKSDFELSIIPPFKHKQILLEESLKDRFMIKLNEDENQDLVVIHDKVVEEYTKLGFKASSDLPVAE